METQRPPHPKRTRIFSLTSLAILVTLVAGLFFHQWSLIGLFPGSGPSPLWTTLPLGVLLGVLIIGLGRLQQRQTKEQLSDLLAQHELLQKIFQDIPGRLVVLDRDYRIRYSNRSYNRESLSRHSSTKPPRCYESFFGQQQIPCRICYLQEVFSNGQPKTWIRHEASNRFIEVRAFPIFDPRGQTSLVAEQICDITQRVLAEKSIRESEKKLQVILQSISDPIRVVNKDLKVSWANKAACKLFGQSILEQTCCALFKRATEPFQESLCPTRAALADGQTHEHILQMPLEDGQIHFFKSASHVIAWDEHQQPSEVLEVFWDITQIKRAEEAVRTSEMLFRTVVESSKDAMVAINHEGRITLFNPGAERIFGRTRQEMLNAPVEQLMPEKQRSSHKVSITDFFSGVKAPNLVGKTLELKGVRGNGEVFPIELSLSEGEIGGERFMLAVIRDITERKLFEQQLVQQATYDALTGLPNRNLILDRLQQAIASKERQPLQLAVMLLDLDKFKTVNDTLGHSGGNILLREMARRLSEVVRSSDTVGRLYGDEFVIILNNVEDRSCVLRVIRSLEQAFEQPFSIDDTHLLLTFSLGIAFFPADGSHAEELLNKADTAMYQSKGSGRNSFDFFAPHMEEQIRRRLQMEKLLQKAVLKEEFYLHYQPRVESVSGRIIGLEVLLRWSPEGLGPIPPDQFIPILEESGWIKEVGRWILKTACQTALSWHKQGLTPLRIWVNISGKQFLEKDFFLMVEEVLTETGMPPRYLGLELTESVLMTNVELNIAKMSKLKDLGLRLSLDDFGTGYSSLAYLKRFPIDEIKIDRSFVDGVIVDENDTAIVLTILAMARSLHLRVVGEGVETPEQRRFLEENLCHEMQGYLFSKPQPAETIAALLSSDACLDRR